MRKKASKTSFFIGILIGLGMDGILSYVPSPDGIAAFWKGLSMFVAKLTGFIPAMSSMHPWVKGTVGLLYIVFLLLVMVYAFKTYVMRSKDA